jgi:hypothetical protein
LEMTSSHSSICLLAAAIWFCCTEWRTAPQCA